jgi:hypothetical protein
MRPDDAARRPRKAAPKAPGAIRQRSWLEIRWRQFRNAPRPVTRAVVASLVLAIVLGVAYLAYDVALTRGATLPGGDLRTLAVLLFIAVVLGGGSVLTYVAVPLPTGSGTKTIRSPWNACLGLFAALPICYLVLVIEGQILKPLLV